MCHILANALIGLDLVEQVSAFCQLQPYPRPYRVFSRGEEPDDVLMWILPRDVFV